MAVIILNQKPNPSNRKRVIVKPIKDPKNIENDARRTIKKMIDPLKVDIEQVINQMRVNPNASMSSIGKQLDDLRKQYEFIFEENSDRVAKDWIDRINKFNRKKTMDELRDALGIDVSTIISEDFQEDLDIMRYEAAMLIKTIPSELVLRVSDRVLQHYKGIPMPENRTLQKQIKEEFNVSDNRAKVIARDQSSKMNTSISAMRQQAVGIDMYVWKTVRDQRVVGKPGGMYKYNPKNDKHKNHYIMEGKICRWDDPTVYSDDGGKTWKARTEEMPKNHPGDDILCRCRPAPYIDIEKLRVKWAI